MRALLLAILALSAASNFGATSVVNIEKAAAPPQQIAARGDAIDGVGVEDKAYTLNVTSYEYTDCTGKATFHTVKEGECLKTSKGLVSPTRPVSEMGQCAAIVYCRHDFVVRDDVVCGECNGWVGNALSDVVECNHEAKTIDFHFYNNIDRTPQRCKYNKYDTLNVPADGLCHYVTGLGSLKITNIYNCSVVGFTLTTGEPDCRSPDAEPKLSTITQTVPNGKCVSGLRVYRNRQE